MKLFLVLTFVGLLSASATTFSQSNISLDMKDVSLRAVLNELERVSQCTFFYNEDFVDLDKNVSVKIQNSDMSSVLSNLFRGTDLTFHHIENKMIVVAPSKFKQNITITGIILDASNSEPLTGVNIIEKGTTNGTATDINGNFKLTVSNGQAVLVVSFIGYLSEEISLAGRTNLEVKLAQDIKQLSEVVVTALGIQKKSRGLTYSTQQVSGEELSSVKDVNMINSLAGKSAGLVIGRSSSGVGGSSRVVIRGNKSISGENQPLYVIDGIPINNSNLGQIGGSQLSGTVDGGDAISNINPEDIENINVLKGAAAAALYGSMGENGVILITTKKGVSGKTTVDVTSSTSFDSPLLLPELQGKYGATTAVDLQKTDNDPSTWGAKDNKAISTSDLRKFFQTGVNTINGVSVTTGNEKNQYYMSYANTSASGIVEKNKLNKNNLYIKANSQITNKLSVEGSANLVTQTVKNRPFVGFENNPVGEAYLYPGSPSDFSSLKDNYQIFDATRGFNVQKYPYSSFNSTSYILDNPYWTINKNPNELKRSRSIFTGGVKWNISNDLTFRARTSYDRIDDQFEQNEYAGTSTIITDRSGAYTLQKVTTTQVYSDALLSYSKNDFGNFSIDASVGASNNYSYGYNLNAASVLGQNNFIAPNVFSLTNLQGTFTHTENTTETLNQSIFGTATMGWKNMLYLDFTGRNEWASTILNETFFYPSVGGTFVLSELTGESNFLSFAKLRGTYSEVGNALPYGVNNSPNSQYWNVLNGTIQNPVNGVPILSDGTPIALKPERSKSTEIGANIRLFSNSIDLDVTYYSNIVENQYFAVAAPLGAYVSNFYVNAGKVRNKGVEVMLGYKYMPAEGLQYSTSVNFAYNNNKIISVNEDAHLNSYTVTQYANTKIAEIRMVKDGKFGDLYATTFKRDQAGAIVVDTTAGKKGAPVAAGEYVYVGNPNSPAQIGWSNTLSYKRFSFRFLIDGKFGGDVISLTESSLDANGRSQRTAEARDAGKVEFEGKTVATDAKSIETWYRGLGGIGSNYVYDATNVRIREVSLGYNVPVTFTKGAIKNINLTVYGRNLLFLYNKAPFDPEVSAGSSTGLQGIEALSLPSTRSLGLSLKVTF